MANIRDRLNLWRDSSLPDGMEVLRASCFDYRYPAHSHDEFVIAAFIRGAQRHRIARYHGIAEPGSIMIIPPGEAHTGEALQSDLGWDYCAFYPTAQFINALATDVLPGAGNLDFGLDLLRKNTALADGLLQASLLASQSQDALERQCAVYDALGTIIARYGERTGRSVKVASRPANIRKAQAFLADKFHGRLSIDDVASAVGLSQYHLMRSFRAATGLSVHQYLTQVRLSHAKVLLAKGISAAQTATTVGFYDQSHLINQFRRYFGVTPKQYAMASR
ncbi:helix-turn-helix transcriptional regulator [Acetobacter cibinongensis]|uniref:AraC family transcriptional regulator n=1 Tax=Acetobacter cibinongensis TaxID=146475 RepID=A0A1Z5YVW0_9PROT|nr:AraC family transcriptional regulator [Acetobacter cibinongensis]OUJ03035.1 AraC family transcriptional regulator [Acetobacter cibinongensis]